MSWDLTLEELFTSPKGFAITTPGPVQLAVCRIAGGVALGELASDEQVRAAVGDVEALPVGVQPTELDLLAGIRTGKSRLAACLALHASQTVTIGHLKAGEIPRVSVVSRRTDLAQVVLDHLVGAIVTSPMLRRLLFDKPKGDSVLVRHPSGRPIEIKVIAGAEAGVTLVARWSAGCVFDEFTRMVGGDDGAVVNYDDCRRAVLGRLLPGAQIVSIGSPWAPMGPAYDRYVAHFGKPSPELVVVKAPAYALNPVYWTPERCEELRRRDEVAFLTDVQAEFADPTTAFITQAELKKATRAEPMVRPSQNDRRYAAGIDAGTRGNSWPLVVVAGYVDKDGVHRFEVVLATQWTGSSLAPLSPYAVFGHIAKLIAPYGNPPVLGDQHSADALQDIATRNGVKFVIKPILVNNRNALFERIKGLLLQGALELPPNPVLLRDLAGVRRKLSVTGVGYKLPDTPDGRHGDYVPALGLALSAFGTAAEAQAREAFARGGEWAMWQLGNQKHLGTPLADAMRAHLLEGTSLKDSPIAREFRVYEQQRSGPKAWASALDEHFANERKATNG